MGEFEDLAPTMSALAGHIPVLLTEVIAGLAVKPGGNYLDATAGGGGHSTAILEASEPDGCVLSLDRDPEAVNRTRDRLRRFGERAQVMHASYAQLRDIIRRVGFPPLDGVLFDLGFSSWQVDAAERGFAFRVDGPLDMRFDVTGDDPTASDLVNELTEAELADLIWRYGEEPHSRRIARAIVEARPIQGTVRLAEVIATAIGRAPKARIHPATRTFQALRIAVNRELDALEAALPRAVEALKPGGRLAVIAFHSLEDRVVKLFFRQEARGCTCPPEAPICTCGHEPTLRIITRKPVIPSAAESAGNPRSRSAKLRIAEKL